MKPIVAIVGRPNVGKSSLFNRLTRTRNAIVDDYPGVSRDRNFGDVRWDETEFTLVDTGGFLDRDEDGFSRQIRFQIDQAVEAADAIVLVLDGKSGISPFDRDLIEMLRGVEKPVFTAVNKIDGPERENLLDDFYALGIEEPFPVSAAHGYGVNDFLDALVPTLPRFDLPDRASAEKQEIRIAVVGRPNVGKSSLVNKMLGQERMVVSEVAGTTRDSVDTLFEFEGQPFRIIDTAGIRRKSRVGKKLEKFSVIKALKSLEECDVALLLLDAEEGITDQDIRIAGYANDRGCGFAFLFNKWDLVEADRQMAKRLREQLKMDAGFLNFAPVLTLSALSGKRISKIFPTVKGIYEQYSLRVGTGQVNKILENATRRNEPSLHRGRRIKFFYATQVATGPPTFVAFVNYPQAVHFSYKRYLINRFREDLKLDKTPIRLFFKERVRRSRPA